MLVSGFTFIRNAVKFDYPIVEAVKSVLPLCDEFILVVGQSDDKTNELIQTIHDPKLKVVPSVWDETLRAGGKVLAVETNKALKEVDQSAIWCIYIQGDECLHEQDYQRIKEAMVRYASDDAVEGLLFSYQHFYGTYDFVSDSFSRYRREIRIIKNNRGITSWGDAQGFRRDGKKLKVKLIDAMVYHYGMVRPPKQQQDRFKHMHLLWHDEETVKRMTGDSEEFEYNSDERLFHFNGSHPAVMQERIKRLNWKPSNELGKKKPKLKIRFKSLIFNLLGIRIGEYKNYEII